MSFLKRFSENVTRFADKVALEFIDPPIQSLTYTELDQLVERSAGYLQSLGLKPGDRVALQLTKCLEFILLHLGILRLGAISLPLNPAYPPDELKYFLEDSGACLFFALQSSRNRIAPLLPGLPELKHTEFLEPEAPEDFKTLTANHSSVNHFVPNLTDTAVIIYTSGTTGRPKGAQITHGNLSANLEALQYAWGWQSQDILLHVLPIFHVHGLFVALHGALHAGATSLLMREFEARMTLRTMIERHCTVLMAVPTIHQRLINAVEPGQFNLSHVRLITSGSDRLPDEVFVGFQKTFGHTLLERYGMTETGMNCSNPLVGERRIGSVGVPLPGVELRIVNAETNELLAEGQIGEIQLRGANIFKGYWKQPSKTADAFTQDGWFRTGDLGFLDPDGYLSLCGRAKDLIISGGMNIYPPEVERVLNEHPAVAASAVIGCADPDWGERVTAVVVMNAGTSVSGDELISFCRQKLAAYKSPKSVIFRSSLPRNAMGKVSKSVLRNEVCI